ncbi:hypothetical protein AB0K51_07430 [Kitasatospora sp. NPDC049285]|uniref:DUF4190 domain-containing protein n=1 Tax=Kitasatospora sp. NPDC049285 TaxID=3157096 RepID=UPI003418B454
MTAPVPPDHPQPEETPAPANPWAVPAPVPAGATSQDAIGAAGGPAGATGGPAGAPPQDAIGAPGAVPVPPYWPPYPVPAPLPRNSQGVAAMVLGIVGAFLSLAVILFWLAWLPALLAVIFGAVGLGYARKGQATNRGMALTGVILGGFGLLVSVGTGVFVAAQVHTAGQERAAARSRADEQWAQQKAQSDAEAKKVEDEARRLQAERDRKAAEQAADQKARRLSIGQSYTYPDGLKVTLAPLVPYTPDETVFKAPKNATIVLMKITVVNTGSKQLSLYGSGSPFVQDAKGTLLFPVIDGSDGMKFLADSVAPGQESTLQEPYALPNGTSDPFTVQFTYGAGSDRKEVIWTGSDH